MNLTQIIWQKNSKNMERICVTHGEKRYTYEDLFSMVNSVKNFLGNNAKKDDKIGLFCENGIEFIAAYLACLDSGVVVVPGITSFSKEELEHVITNSDIKLFLCSKKMKKKLNVRVPVFTISDLINTNSAKSSESSNRPESKKLAALIYTSGSTGKPNAVMITHPRQNNGCPSILLLLRGISPSHDSLFRRAGCNQ